MATATFWQRGETIDRINVAPFAGAWIEISTLWRTCHRLPGPAKPREQYKQLRKSTTKLKNL